MASNVLGNKMQNPTNFFKPVAFLTNNKLSVL